MLQLWDIIISVEEKLNKYRHNENDKGGIIVPRAYTENRKLHNQKWDSENLDRMSIAFPKGTKEKIKQAATDAGESMNQYIYTAVLDRLHTEADTVVKSE